MKMFKTMLLVFAAAFFLQACEQDGPFEDAGEDIDQAVEDTGNAIEDACEEAKEAAGAEDKDC
ncbi:MAG: hypothetical protein HKN58_08830 [Xanthomonadales bacterium]|nr:hypothetical protein [Xanthomonadales bacterium]